MATKKNEVATADQTAKGLKKRAAVHFPPSAKPEEARALGDFVLRSSVNAACVVEQYGRETFGELDTGALSASLSDGISSVNDGDMRQVEGMLFAQAVALQTIFTNMARRAPKQDLMAHWEAYMRMAMRAQNQCRMTLETLATIKNPPVVFARQANINNGGQQQVNNGLQAEAPRAPALFAHAGARAANSQRAPTEVLEASDVQRLDTRAASAASGTDQGLAPVGALDRTEDC